MNITLGLTVFRWRIATFDIDIDMPETTLTQPVIDRGVKRASRWWANRMSS